MDFYSGSILQQNGFEFLPENDRFYREEEWLRIKPQAGFRDSGWVINVSVDPADVRKAANILGSEITSINNPARELSVRVARGDTVDKIARLRAQGLNAKSMIQIYVGENYTKFTSSRDELHAFLQHLENRLGTQVRPGTFIPGRQIKGSSFFSYRSYLGEDFGTKSGKGKNKSQRLDPGEGLSIQPNPIKIAMEQAARNAVSDIAKWGWESVKGKGLESSFEVRVKDSADAKAKIDALRAAGMDGKGSLIEGKINSVRLTKGHNKFLPAWTQFVMANNPPARPSGRRLPRPH